MADKYRLVGTRDGHYVVNRRTGNVLTRSLNKPEAERVRNAFENGLVSKIRSALLEDEGLSREIVSTPPVAWVASGSGFQSWQAEIEDSDPQDWEDFSGPVLVAVSTASPGTVLAECIRVVTQELREGEFDGDPETGEPWMDGMNPLDGFKWVDSNDKPYDPECPLQVRLWVEMFGSPKIGSLEYGRRFEPHGYPEYRVYLREGNENPKTEHYHACVVVQERILV